MSPWIRPIRQNGSPICSMTVPRWSCLLRPRLWQGWRPTLSGCRSSPWLATPPTGPAGAPPNPAKPASARIAGPQATTSIPPAPPAPPKGVMVEHANVGRLLTATEHWFGFGPADVWTLFHSYAFDFSVWELWGALAYGGRLIVIPQLTSRSPDEFYRLICRAGVTVLNQ